MPKRDPAQYAGKPVQGVEGVVLPGDNLHPMTVEEAELGLDLYLGRMMVWPNGELRDHLKVPDQERISGFGDGVLLERDPRWRALRLAFVRKNPTCRVCGRTRKLEVHHKQPFHLFPELELVESNLMTLCQGASGVNCHLIAGHGCDWSRYVKDPELVATFMRLNIFVTLQPQTRMLLTDAIREKLGAKMLRMDRGFNEGDTQA